MIRTFFKQIALAKVCLLFAIGIVAMPENTHAQFAQQQLWQSLQFRLGQAIIRVAEQGEIADTVAVWGDVRAPGVYMVPQGTTISELVSYAGGPVVAAVGDATIDWARFRIEITLNGTRGMKDNSRFEKYTFRYNERLQPGLYQTKLESWDQVNLQIRRRPNFRDWILLISPVLSSIVTTLVIFERI
jgi:hypothetical protein